MGAFGLEVLLELLAELGDLDPDDGVGGGVVAGLAGEDFDADALFGERGAVAGEAPVAEEREKLAKAGERLMA